MSDINKMSKKDLLKLIEQQQNQLRIAQSKIKEVKEFSEVFINAKTKEFIKYKNLSETKRHFEEQHLSFLKEKQETFTSKQFHDLLSSLIK